MRLATSATEITWWIQEHNKNLNQLDDTPRWIIEKELEEEHTNNWLDAYREDEGRELPQSEHMITSHVIYKVNMGEDGEQSMKSRIFPHGNNDKMIDTVRKDWQTAQFHAIRLLLALVTFLTMRLGDIDIIVAYMHSGPVNRHIYVNPPWMEKDYKRAWMETTEPIVWRNGGRLSMGNVNRTLDY